MAITKCLHMKQAKTGYPAKHLANGLRYIMNPEKTEHGRYVCGHNCIPEQALSQMVDTKRHFGKLDKRQGYHFILSFEEDEVSEEEAFQVVGEFVAEFLGKDFEAVYAVHNDTDHIHGHIIFNSVRCTTGYKYDYKKGEILRCCGGMLKAHGYRIRVLNLVEMEQSNGYNPFRYIRSETDIVKLVTNLINNTTPKNAQPSDPFWEKAESLYLQAIFLYVWQECEMEKRNFRMVLQLLNEAEVHADGSPSDLDRRFRRLERKKGSNHPALIQYNKVIRGAGDTVRSIIISANARLGLLQNPQILRILDHDEMEIEEIGLGVDGDRNRKTALFCVTPDSDKSYAFLIGMLYSQIFQELYYQADFHYNGKLPINVNFMLDEFANVPLPDDYCCLLSTMRSRNISCTIFIQNLAQIKALFEKTWETIPGNCVRPEVASAI